MSAQVRSIRFEYDDSFIPEWHPRLPEFACVANAVSLMMPYAEPYIVKSVRRSIPNLEADLQVEATAYSRQEMEHHKQHRKLNDIVVASNPKLRRVERAMDRTFNHLLEHRSQAFNLAFAAGFETLAYTGARWTERQLGSLFDGADPTASTLFLWHLAEEVEHKTVAYDVFQAVSAKRLTQFMGILVSTFLLIFFAWWSTWSLLFSQRQVHRPIVHLHLLTWSFGFAFDLLPALFVSLWPSHNPRDLTDPTWYSLWLKGFDAESGTIPLWNGAPSEPDGPDPSRHRATTTAEAVEGELVDH